jgi:hypothetical protein
MGAREAVTLSWPLLWLSRVGATPVALLAQGHDGPLRLVSRLRRLLPPRRDLARLQV